MNKIDPAFFNTCYSLQHLREKSRYFLAKKIETLQQRAVITF